MLELASFKAKEVEIMVKKLQKIIYNLMKKVLKNNIKLFTKLTKVFEIEFVEFNEGNKPKNMRDNAMPGKPLFVIGN